MTLRRRSTFFGTTTSSSSSRAFDADVLSWEAAVIANGGTVSLARRIIADQFIYSEKTSGAWALTDDYAVLWGENSIQALTTLKRRVLMSAVNAPTFTVDRGFTTDGVTSYINTFFAPSVNAVSMTVDSVHAEIYERTELGQNSYAFGVSNTGSRGILIRPRTTTSINAGVNSANGSFTLLVNDSRGLSQVGRSGPTGADSYGAKNGVDLVMAIAPATVGVTLPAHDLFIGAMDNTGTAASFRANFYGFAAYGAALTGAQRLARYNNVQAWATSVGAQV